MKRVRPPENRTFCMAPWTHTYLSPQSERRLCCASRETHSYIHQYIDQPGASGGEYRPVSLEEHWNGELLRSVRRRMMAGETLPECEVCHDQVLNLHTYQKYFTETLFKDYVDRAFESTDDDGRTTMQPISFDYRLTNRCNYKCRMCGEQLSSAWENEKRENGEWSPERDPWMIPEVRSRIDQFQKSVAEAEFARAISAGIVEELYWVGGEPLVWEEHWQYMTQLMREGNAHKVFARYNTNLSRIVWNGVNLFELLQQFKGYNVCASIDAAGKVGELIRTGLKWESFLANFEEGVKYKRGREDTIVMDVTLTLPGLFGMKELLDEANRLDVKMYVKIMFAFDPSIVLSPFALPRELLDEVVDDLIAYVQPRTNWKNQALLDTLVLMKQRPTFRERWPESWKDAFVQGRRYQRRLAERRGDGESGRLRLEDVYAAHPRVLDWWTGEP
jgi:hypothetical protein